MTTPDTPTIQYLVLERSDLAQNMDRFYVLSITPTLFTESALVRQWGRKGRRERSWIELHADPSSAGEALGVWLQKKIKLGYKIKHAA